MPTTLMIVAVMTMVVKMTKYHANGMLFARRMHVLILEFARGRLTWGDRWSR